MENSIYGEEIAKLDLARYGLAELDGRNVLDLDQPDMNRLLAALGEDDISLNVPISCSRENLEDLLAHSYCRRCGRCCRPNPLNPGSPGVEVFEDELRAIADYLREPYENLRKNTAPGKATPYAFQVVELGFTRWLPLPCPFHDDGQDGCRVYPVRPVVCKIHPVIFTGDDSYMSIRVTCDYGKDLIMAAYKRLRTADPNLEIRL